MELPDYTTIIITLTGHINKVTQSFIYFGYDQLVRYLEKPVAMSCIVLIALTGYGIMQGFIEMSAKAFYKLALTIGLVYMFAFGWAHFNDYFIGLFLESANEIAGVLVGGRTFEFPLLKNTGTGLDAALQTVLIEAVKVGGWTMSKAGFTDWLPSFIGFMFILTGTVVVAIAAIEIIIVKLYLAMLLAVSPFFISCALFPQTKGQFDGWLNQLKGFAISLMLLGVAISLCMYLMHWVVGGYFVEHALSIRLYSLVPLIIATLLSIMLLVGVVPIAKQIGGSHGGSGWGAVTGAMAGAAGGAMAAASMGAKAGKTALNARKPAQTALQYGGKFFSNIRKSYQQGQ